MDNKDLLIKKIELFIRKYYNNIAIRGGIIFAAILLILFLVISLFEYFTYSNSILRTILFYSFIGINLVVLIYHIFIPLLKKNGLLKRLSYEDAAKIIGRYFPEIEDKLLNTIQLNKMTRQTSTIKSMELLLASIDFKIEQIKPFSFHKAVNFKKNLKYIKYAAIPLGIIIIIFAWNSSVFTEPTHRIVHYNQAFTKPLPYQFIIENTQLKSFQNEDFTLKIKVEGEEVPEEAFIEINNNLYKLTQETNIQFSYIFKNLQQNLTFRFVTDEMKSQFYELTVLPKPLMINFSISLEYPVYVQKINETVDNNGDLSIPQGTKINWKFNTRNTEEILLLIDDKTHTLSHQSDIFTFSMRAMSNLSYTIFNKNKYVTNSDSLHYFINVIPDHYPQIEVVSMNDSIFFDRFYFKGNISDDYGFKKLEFVYTITNEKDTFATTHSINIPIDLSLNRQDFYYYFDAQTLNLALGQTLSYYFEIWDNDGVNGSKSSRTTKMEFQLPSEKEIEKQVDNLSTQTKSDMSKLIKESNKILKKIEDLKKKMSEKNQIGWEEKKQMEDLLKQLQNLKKEVENLNVQQEKQLQIENQHQFLNEEILKKQEELQKRFNELFSDEMKQMMEEIQMLMQRNMDKNTMKEMIDKMEFSTEELNKQLDQDLSLFKQLEFEKKINNTINNIYDLSEKQKQLAKETADKKNNNKQQIEKQQEIQKEFNELMEDVKALQQLNQTLEEPYQLPNINQLEQDVLQNMQEAQEQLQKNKNDQSAKSQEKAGENMEEIAEKMDAAFSEQQSKATGEDIQTLTQILYNIVKTSFQQEELMLQLSKTNSQNPKLQQIVLDQFKMKDQLQMIEDSINAVARRQPAVESFITKKISSINNAQKQILASIQLSQEGIPAIYNYNRNFYDAVAKQQYVMTSLNDLALMLAESIDRMKDSQESAGSCKSGSCKSNKNSKKGKNNMKSMREMQEKLNQQLEELRKQMQNQGNKPDGKNTGQQGQSVSEQLARMAAQQEAIRRMMQDYQSELKKEGKGYDGQLEQMMKEMEQTEKDLVNKILNQQTINRQQQIMTRLLQSERAEMQREKEEKRESKEGKDIQRTSPNEVFDKKLKQEKEIELYKTIPPNLNYYYKNKVNSYFYNMQ